MKALNIALGSRDHLNVKSKASGTTTRITGGTASTAAAGTPDAAAVDFLSQNAGGPLGLSTSATGNNSEDVARMLVKKHHRR